LEKPPALSDPFYGVEEYELIFYRIKIVIKLYKTDEFVESMRSFARKIRKEKGCRGYSLYRDFEKENTFSVIGEWRTRPAIEKHFKTQNFEVLIGAARVLGETFEMNIAEVLETGGFKLAKHFHHQNTKTLR
jgi:quinol monooxygenase YgiN